MSEVWQYEVVVESRLMQQCAGSKFHDASSPNSPNYYFELYLFASILDWLNEVVKVVQGYRRISESGWTE